MTGRGRSLRERLLAVADDMTQRHAPGTNHCTYGGSVQNGWVKHSASQPCPDVLAARRLRRLAKEAPDA